MGGLRGGGGGALGELATTWRALGAAHTGVLTQVCSPPRQFLRSLMGCTPFPTYTTFQHKFTKTVFPAIKKAPCTEGKTVIKIH